MRRVVCISLFLMLLAGQLVFAQNEPSPKAQERRMNAKVIDMVMRLEEESDISSRQDGREYLSLFENRQSPVLCDLFSSGSFLQQIPADQYVDLYVNQDSEPEFNALVYEFRNIRKVGWSHENGRWVCQVSLEKTLSYFDNNLIFYPMAIQNPHNVGFMLDVYLVFSEDCSDCRISRIECANVSDFEVLDNYYYVVQKNEDPEDALRDEGLMVGDTKVVYNDFGQGYAPDGEFSFWDDDVKVSQIPVSETDRYEQIRFKYDPIHFRFRVRAEYSPFFAYVVSSENRLTSSSDAYNVGFDFGYSFPVSRIFKFDISAGLGVTVSNLHLHGDAMSYSYDVSSISLGDYSRNYQINELSQDARFVDLTVPVYFTWELRLHERVSLLLDLGAKAYFNTVASTFPLHVRGRVHGFYEDGSTVSGSDGLGNIDTEINRFVSYEGFRRKPVDVSLFGNLGVDVGLYPKVLYLQVKIGFEYGLMESYDAGDKRLLSTAQKSYPLVWDYSHGSEVAFRSLMEVTSLRRKALWFSLGLMLKF